MNKRYRLKKDIQSPLEFCKAGTESEMVGIYYCFKYDGCGENSFGKSFFTSHPQDFPEWFEEIKEQPERITVTVSNECFAGGVMLVRPNKSVWKVPKEKNELIKQAIERVLNDNPPTTDTFQWTDELVNEFVNIRIHDGNPNAETGLLNAVNKIRMEQFKQSKTELK